jgi:hypothetical protein
MFKGVTFSESNVRKGYEEANRPRGVPSGAEYLAENSVSNNLQEGV